MKNLLFTLIGLCLLNVSVAKGPTYASKEAKTIIEKMVNAHGGYEKWKAIDAMSFSNVMHSPSLGFVRFWVHDQTIDMKTRRLYQDWPLFGSKLSFDGKEVWTVDWRVPNPPAHQQSVFFYYLNLPWLTQDDHVVLGEPELVEHKGFDNKVYKVKMTYKKAPAIGKTDRDSYTLYIDSESYLLAGYEYTMSYGPILDAVGLPKDQKVFGPVLRKNNYIADVNGLKFAILFTTHDSEMTAQYGDHAIYDLKIDAQFDETRMTKPANAVVDPAIDKRQ
ncbi:MAG: hypothetical protein RIM99_00095 [Cyclobacteriaceae bacterium]